MNYKKFTEKIKSQIDSLTNEKCIEFGLDICNRLFPDYFNFYHINNWGDPKLLEEAISFCETSKSNIILDQNVLTDLTERIETAIPDTEEFGENLGTYALNSSACVLELLEFLADRKKNHIFNISGYMTDTIDFKINENNPNLSAEEVDDHAEMTTERNRQIELTT